MSRRKKAEASEYVCMKSGDPLELEGIQPSLDDRWALGFCVCTPYSYSRNTRDLQKGVRRDLWEGVKKAQAVEEEKRRRSSLLSRVYDPGAHPMKDGRISNPVNESDRDAAHSAMEEIWGR